MKFKFRILYKSTETSVDIDEPIYMDDTIENVKYKLSKVLPIKNVKYYYLFYKRETQINAYDAYKQLSLNDTVPINKKKFVSFCVNCNIKNYKDKEYYDIDDFLELELDKPITVNEPIGIETGNYIVNPYDNVFNYDENIQSTSNTLLMNYPNLTDVIYVCIADRVYHYVDKKGLDIEHVVNVYYPYLYSEKKFNMDVIEEGDTKYEKYNKMIHFQQVKYNKELSSKQKGVTSIYLVIYTKQKFLFPIDIFFKLMQSTLEYPFIKLNPGRKQENIYRIYSPKISENGNKVPYFKKNRINKIINTFKKPNTLYYIIDEKYKEKIITIIFEMNDKGHIFMTMNELDLLSFEEIEEIIKKTTDNIINKLIEFFDPSQKIFNYFTTLNDENVEIIDLKYKYLFKKQPKFEINKYVKCFSSIFNFVEEKEYIRLRYKRVSNFNELDSMDAYIIELINQQQSRDHIINTFSHSYNVTLEDATQKF